MLLAVKYCAICAGNSRMLTAKMIGITPAWSTLQRQERGPTRYSADLGRAGVPDRDASLAFLDVDHAGDDACWRA